MAIKVGYWHSKYEPDLPRPVSSEPLEENLRTRVINYLKNGQVKHRCRGFSTCRVCGCMNGTKCLTDGPYQWPEGLAHYVEEHNIELPDKFMEHLVMATAKGHRLKNDN